VEALVQGTEADEVADTVIDAEQSATAKKLANVV
jgi:hypothetical protein